MRTSAATLTAALAFVAVSATLSSSMPIAPLDIEAKGGASIAQRVEYYPGYYPPSVFYPPAPIYRPHDYFRPYDYYIFGHTFTYYDYYQTYGCFSSGDLCRYYW